METPPIGRILKLNANEWPYILWGVFFSAIAGSMPVVAAIIMAEILQVIILFLYIIRTCLHLRPIRGEGLKNELKQNDNIF